MVNIQPCLGYIKHTGTSKGRGVFAARKIYGGELVEACPVVVIGSPSSQTPLELRRIVFDWGFLTNGPVARCLALGWGSMYNHANPANMKYLAYPDSYELHFISVRDIERDEELTINYNHTGGEVSSTDDVWFRTQGIDLIS